MRTYTRADAEADLELAIERGDLDEAARLADWLDHADPPPPPTLPGSALWYADHGLPVFPLMPGTKVPYPKSHGVLGASTNPELVRAWWADTPDANIGLATGHGVDVLDFDGHEAHAAWGARFPGGWQDAGVMVLGTVSTPRPGGLHVYTPSNGRGNRAGMLPGVDYRGAGGYVVVPPSRTELGTYIWLRRLELP